jgi:putative ABC transport system substrate-binding protein
MRRRAFMTLLGGAAASWPFAARAQPTGKLPIIGFLGTNTASAQRQWTDAFLQRLRELGWIEGRTIAIEYRWADGRLERSAEIVAELVRLKVDVIVTHSAEPVLAAKRETAVIPIIFPVVADPVGSGVVASLTRPDGNATGLSLQAAYRNFARGSTGFSPVGDRGEFRCSCCRVRNARGTGGGQHGWSGNYHV